MPTVLDNVLSKMQGTPAFKPAYADTFGDWSLEAGDIITVETDTRQESMPIFSTDTTWTGAARTSLTCTGSKERGTIPKQQRQSYNSGYGLSSSFNRGISQVNGTILEQRNELVAALNGEDGAPEDLASGIQNYVRYDLENGEAMATSRLFSEIGEKAKSEIQTYTFVDANGNTQSIASIGVTAGEAKAGLTLKADKSTVNGISKSVATLQADVIELNGRVDVTGHLSVSSSGQITSLGPLVAASSFQIGQQNGFWIYGQNYVPTEITSTTGPVTVLGY